jgi:hypothetical protein
MNVSFVPPYFWWDQHSARKLHNIYEERKNSMPEKCTPVPISSDDIKYDSKAFALLELDGSANIDEFINPTKEDIQSVDNSLLYASEYQLAYIIMWENNDNS